MTNIPMKYITDKDGNQVLPISHVSAIRDDQGNNIGSLLGSESDARQNADAALGTQISAETSARQSADSSLQSNINSQIATEQAARQSATTTLQNNITAETNRALVAEEQLRQAFESLSDTDILVIQPSDTWPVSSPALNVIYRVIDRVNTPPQIYSDYIWDGSGTTLADFILMATYNNAVDTIPTPGSHNLVESGGVASHIVYDISEANAGSTYPDLATALGTNGINVPESIRKGGMSIKFVQSSDNKYVQYRLMSDSFSTTVTDWQGVDNEPTAGSNNLVKSGGVHQNYIEKKFGNNIALPQEFTRGATISAAGTIQTGFSDGYIVTGFIPVNGQNISANMWAGSASYSAGNVYDSNFKFIRTLGQVSKYTYQSGDAYVRLCIKDEADNRPRAFYGDTLKMYEAASPIIGYQDIDNKSHALNILNGDAYKRVRELYLVGLDLTKAYKTVFCNVYISGDYYETRVSIKDGDTIIAAWYELVNGYTGIVQFTERNNSGISGWGFVDIPSNSTEYYEAEINNAVVSDIDFNQNIRSAVYGIYTNIENKNIYKHVRLLLPNGATVGSVVNSSFQNVDSKCVVFSHVKKGDVCRLTAPAGYDGDYTLPSYIFIDNDNKCVEYSAARLQNVLKVATTDGTMYIQGAMSDTVKFQRLEETPKIFNVTKEGVGFSSLLEGILEATKYVESTLYVGKGTYDVESEFKAHYGNDFFTNFASDSKVLGMYLKNRVKVIFDSGAKVVFNYEGGNQYVNSLFSPFNGDIMGFEIENLDIECANCRYCIHDELGHLNTPYKNVYKNCKMSLDNTQNEHWASKQCIGGGLGPTGEIIIKDCYFNSVESNSSAVSYHNSSANNAMSTIVVSGCYFERQNSLAFGCYGQSTKKTRVMASNNSLGGEITKWFQTEDSQDNIELIKFNNTIRQVQ